MANKATQKDNSTGKQKITLRRKALERMSAAGVSPVILETHGGYGHLYKACYAEVLQGAVFDTDPSKASRLALQRPTWAVYEADSEVAIREGAVRHLPITLLDCDPYGNPFPILDAFFSSDRPKPSRVWVVVNDGLRQAVALNRSWAVDSLKEVVAEFGNDLHREYLSVCRLLVERYTAKAGYKVGAWTGYYTGANKNMTHYLAELQR